MVRAHKIRLNPTPEQATYFKKACGTSRFVFNWGLERWREQKALQLAHGAEGCGPARLKAEFNALKREQYPWVMEVTKNAVEDGFRRLGAALKNYFESKKGQRKGPPVRFPRFKSKKKARQSFTLDYERFQVEGHWLTISKLDRPVNLAEPLRFEGQPQWATISCVAGRWYVSISVEWASPEQFSPPQEAVGIDVGVKTLATLSDGREFENQKLLRSELAHYQRLSRRLSRRQPGSQRWRKAQRQVARFQERIANRRLDFIHKMTTEIARTYRLVVVEDLHVQGMMRNRRLALSLADASLGEILRQLACKSTRLVQVGRFYASSQTCSACGYVHRELELSERRWVCAACGVLHERDWNAAVNILQEGLRLAT